MEEKFTINDSETKKNLNKRSLLQTTQKELPHKKTNDYHIDDIWTWDILDLKDYGPSRNEICRYVLVVIDIFSNFDWTVLLKNKNARTIKDCFQNYPKSSKRKPKLIESDRGKDFYISNFQNFLCNYNTKHYSRISSILAVFAERFYVTIGDLLKRPVFKRGDANWIDVLPTITKQYNNRIHSWITLTPLQPSLKKNEGFVYKTILDRRKIIQPKHQVNILVRVADLKRTFSKGDTTNWSFKMYEVTEIYNDTLPCHRIEKLKERDNEVLLKKNREWKK